MDALARLLETHTRFDGDLNRNVAGIRTAQDLFDDLEATPQERLYALALESRTRESTSAPVIERPFVNGVAPAWPFLEENWHGTRYSDGTRHGVWYGSPALRTIVYETVYHWLRFVADSFPEGTTEVIADRHVFLVHCQAELVDLRGREAQLPALVDPFSHAETRRLGRLAHARGEQGLLAPSARHGGGVIAAIFRQSALSHARSHCDLTYRWTWRSEDVTVERTPGRTWLRVPAPALPEAH